MEFQDQQRVQVRMRFTSQAAYIALAHRSYWEAVEEQPDKVVVVTFSTPDLGWAASSALAYGPIVTMLRPPVLHRMIGEWAQEIVGLFQLNDAYYPTNSSGG
jgi:predicted DNA-binding transcriptional regulator YafY